MASDPGPLALRRLMRPDAPAETVSPPPDRRRTRAYVVPLAVLTAAFFLRVVGQPLVVVAEPRWLPPMDWWQSGLLPYPVLLASQAAVLTTQGLIIIQLWTGRGVFASHRPRFGTALRTIAIAYFAVMVVRYAVVMTLRPELRWHGHAVPVVFHCVLAAFLFVLSRCLRGLDLGRRSSQKVAAE